MHFDFRDIHSLFVLDFLLRFFFSLFLTSSFYFKTYFCCLITWARGGQSLPVSLAACVASSQCLCHIWVKGDGAKNHSFVRRERALAISAGRTDNP